MTENINADGQETTVDEQTTGASEDVATSTNEDVVSKAEYEKAKAEAEKREGRYKSSMKKSNSTDTTSQKPTKDTDGLSTEDFKRIVDERLSNIKAEESFIREHGREALNDELREIMNEHPTLGYEEAFKLTSIGQDPAMTANANTTTVVGDSGNVSGRDPNSITESELYSLSDAQYAAKREEIDKGKVTLVAG